MNLDEDFKSSNLGERYVQISVKNASEIYGFIRDVQLVKMLFMYKQDESINRQRELKCLRDQVLKHQKLKFQMKERVCELQMFLKHAVMKS